MNNQVGPHRPRNTYRAGAGPRVIDVEYQEVRHSAFRTQKDKVDLAYLALWAYILGKFALVGLMWLFNIVGLKGINLFLGLAELLIFAFLAFAPKNLIGSGIIGGVVAALMDRDKTQGIATGPYWLYRIALVIGFGSMFAAFYLATWSFQASPESFWAIFGGVLILLMAEQVTRKSSVWGMRFITAYALFTIALASWQTFGIELSVPNGEMIGSATSAVSPQFVESIIAWWPLAAIVALAVVSGLVPRLRSAAKISIAAVVVIWLVTSGQVDSIMGGSKPFIGQASSGACAVQNNLVVPESGKLRVTLCSQELEYKNIMSVQRSGPRPVKVRFAESTLRDYGDQINASQAEEFVSLQEAHSLGQNFHFLVMPNNEKFYQLGLHRVPLDFTIEYYKEDISSE